MADTDTDPYTLKPHQPNPTKFYTHFLYKAIIVSIFLLLLPFFPSQAPEVITQNRSWEFLQLIFVGIAVSYGLFSKRNDDVSEKEHGSKLDTAQSYVSRLLQVSSVFDEERENPCGLDDNKVQTWNSQYYRNEPMVVVAQEEKKGISSKISETPLLLPIRSLKTHVSEFNSVESINGSGGKSGNVSKPDSKRFSRNGDFEILNENSEYGSKRFSGNSNLSRNGDFEGVRVSESFESGSKRFSDVSNKYAKEEFEAVTRIEGSGSGSKRFSSVSNETNVGEFEGGTRIERSGSGSKPFSSISNKSIDGEFDGAGKIERSGSGSKRFSSVSNNNSGMERSASGSKRFSNVVNKSINGEFKGANVVDVEDNESVVLPSPIPWRSRSGRLETSQNLDSELPSFKSQSFRSLKSNSNSSSPKKLLPTHSFLSPKNVADSVRKKGYHKSSPPPPPPPPPPYFLNKSPLIKSNSNEGLVENELKRSVKSVPMEYIQNKKEIVEKVVVEADEDSSESGEDEFEENSNIGEIGFKNNGDEGEGEGEGGPDVDKKADEFIARFREQIRLQRIASIRKSTGQLPRSTLR